MKKPDFDKARQYVFERLQKEIDPRLTYHNIYHTKDVVFPACERLADHEGISQEDKILVLTGALYHDIGFIKQYRKNEPISAEIASETLPGFGYDSQQIEVIRGIILSTVLPQSPTTHLDKIMCDSDLFHFGMDEFLTLSTNLWHELLAFGYKISELAWFEDTLKFIQAHRYFTKSADLLVGDKKKQNIERVKKVIERLKGNN